uniref:Uncharacterized protein n=1 Tax=Rhizophora mucronata TaxID=61149 RepID=A0A2P2QP10_RHIMU
MRRYHNPNKFIYCTPAMTHQNIFCKSQTIDPHHGSPETQLHIQS